MKTTKQDIPSPPKCENNWALLKELDVDHVKVKQRSAVFQRTLNRDGQKLKVFIKIYSYNKHPLQRLWRAGRSRTEARNLTFFKQIGIIAPQVIDWGDRRNLIGKPTYEFIITEAMIGTQQLDQFFVNHCPNVGNKNYINIRNQIIDTIAEWTRRIHQHNFFHLDLKWRNILARLHNGVVQLSWIDCPEGGFKRTPGKHLKSRLKDCATLDKIARYYCTPEERHRFIARYLNCELNDPEVAIFSKQVNDYRCKRFDPEDEPPKLECYP